jgi:hypothetical protein
MDRMKIFYDIRHKRLVNVDTEFEEGEEVESVLNVQDVQSVVTARGKIAFKLHGYFYIVHPNDTGAFRTMLADWSEFFPPTP